MIKIIRKMFYYFYNKLVRKRWEIVRELINKNNSKVIVEIGVWKGDTSEYLLKNCNLNKLYCIDPYLEQITACQTQGLITTMAEAKDIAIKRLKDTRAKLIIKKSEDAVKDFEDESIDLIFIDGNHKYEEVKKDIKLWYPKLRNNGILCGDDYSLQTFGVIKAVNEKFAMVNLTNRIWWINKK